MFSFFEKKRYLGDMLGGFVDVHNHILPAIDDGAQNVEESLAMIREFGELGIIRFVATPHIHPLYPNTPKSIADAQEKLLQALAEKNITDVDIEPAAEHMIYEKFESFLESGKVMKLRKGYLLVEMSFLQPPLNFENCIEAITGCGLTPILAHPERYHFLSYNDRNYFNLKDKGILMQLNMPSLGKYYGPDVQKAAFSLLDKGLIDFVASDAHSQNSVKALRDIRLSGKHILQVERLIQGTIDAFH